MANRILDSKSTMPGLPLAIQHAARRLHSHQNAAIVARQRACWASAREHSDAAQRYVLVLGRLEDLADSLGLLAPCCPLAAHGEFCRCP